jgi:Shikimate kinase
MKALYLIGGTMGVGKTTISKQLKQELNQSVFLDGDWCWDMHPLIVNEETKAMVLDNICHLLNNFIHCSSYENIIFCWVMHEQSIIDGILKKLDTSNLNIKSISLISDEASLTQRIAKDIASNLRQPDVLKRSLERLAMYQELNTIKIDTSNKDIPTIINTILKA